MNEFSSKLFDAWIVRFTHPVIHNCSPFAVLWGVSATGEVVCASEPQEAVGNTIKTRDGDFVIEGALMERDDIPLEYREALCLGVTPTECVEFVIQRMSKEDVMKFAQAKRLKKKFIGKGEEEQEGMGL